MTTALLCTLAGLGLPTDPARLVQNAHLRLLAERHLTLTASAAELRGKQRTEQQVTLGFVHQPGYGDVRLELMVHEGGRLTHRIAADGTRLWAWEARGNTYLSRPYANDDGLFPDWRVRLFSFLSAQTSGVSSFVTRVLSDAFSGPSAQGQPWRPWIPTAKLSIEEAAVVARGSSPVPTTTTYFIERKDAGDFALSAIVHETALRTGESATASKWTVEIHPGRLPEGVQFEFTPPRGSRARTNQTGS